MSNAELCAKGCNRVSGASVPQTLRHQQCLVRAHGEGPPHWKSRSLAGRAAERTGVAAHHRAPAPAGRLAEDAARDEQCA